MGSYIRNQNNGHVTDGKCSHYVNYPHAFNLLKLLIF